MYRRIAVSLLRYICLVALFLLQLLAGYLASIRK